MGLLCMKRHPAVMGSLCLAAQSDDADDGTVNGEVDELALLDQRNHPLTSEATAHECSDETYYE